jgi:hypothetical protein
MSDGHVYFYSGRLALGLDAYQDTIFSDIFENGYEAIFMSHLFTDYKECIHDSSGLMREIAGRLYERTAEQYSMVWESNPANPDSENYGKHSATETIKPWSPSEIIRFYVIPDSALDSEEAVITPLLMSIYGGSAASTASLPTTKLKH